MNEEKLVAEQVVPMESAGSVTVRISQDTQEEFWRVDVSRSAGSTSTTVAPGDSFMMNLIEGAVSGEPVAWRHLAHWGRDALGPTSAGRPRFA
ncbi:MAG TPA: hypothetical protein VG435_08860 [Acidimicrobiales bacterium]|nr:hypothetical protein [Acidimicrobiales bacterium]